MNRPHIAVTPSAPTAGEAGGSPPLTRHLLNYTGASMRPTFQPGDGLILEPYSAADAVRAGDVVLFIHPQKGYEVVHRVVRVADGSVRTRGDNNRRSDPYLVAVDRLLGRVVERRRRGRTARVPGGIRGLALHTVLRAASLFATALRRPVRPLYFGLAARGWFQGWHRPFCDIRCVQFRRPEGIEYQMVWRRRCVAVRKAGQTNWQVRFPFRLFLDLEKGRPC